MIAALTFVPFWVQIHALKKDLAVSGQLRIKKKKDGQVLKQTVNTGWIQGNQRQSLAGGIEEGSVDCAVAQAGKPG